MKPASKMTPFLFCHGIRDMVVQYRRGEEAHAATLSQHSTVDFLDYPVGHEVCMEELRDVRKWLHARFAWARETESNRAHGPKDAS
jgi:phospholipase/carboxylesterase